MNKTDGLIAATYTPFTERDEINLDLIPAYAEHLKKIGVRGVFVNGTTGEGVSLSYDERRETARTWIAQKNAQFKVMIHIGHNSPEISRKLAIHAQKGGADGIGTMGPTFFRPQDLNALVDYNVKIANAAPELPYYYYHIPSMTGAYFSMLDFLKKAGERIPNLAGIKFTHVDFMDMKLCLEYKSKQYDILHGTDEILLSGLVLGVKGAIGSTYNYVAPLFVKLLDAWKNNNLEQANALQLKAMEIVKVLIKYGGATRAGKSFMRLIGLDFGQPRLPITGLSSSEEIQLRKDLELLQFLKYTDLSLV